MTPKQLSYLTLLCKHLFTFLHANETSACKSLRLRLVSIKSSQKTRGRRPITVWSGRKGNPWAFFGELILGEKMDDGDYKKPNHMQNPKIFQCVCFNGSFHSYLFVVDSYFITYFNRLFYNWTLCQIFIRLYSNYPLKVPGPQTCSCWAKWDSWHWGEWKQDWEGCMPH